MKAASLRCSLGGDSGYSTKSYTDVREICFQTWKIFLVRSVLAVRDLSLEELKKIPGFVRTTTEGVIFDTKTNAQNFLKSDTLKNAKEAAIKSRAETSGIARQKKSANPKLFARIIKLAEEGKTPIVKIGRDPAVVRLNNGPIDYGNIKNIITREKGEKFFNKIAEAHPREYYKSPDRIFLEKNLKNIMKNYYAGMGTQRINKKIFTQFNCCTK